MSPRRWAPLALLVMVGAFTVGFLHILDEASHDGHDVECPICSALSLGAWLAEDPQSGGVDREVSIASPSIEGQPPRSATAFPAFLLRGPPAFS